MKDPLQKGRADILVFRSLNKTHLGTYTCTVTSPQGTAVATYNLWTEGKEGIICPYSCAHITPAHQPSC